MAIYIWLFVLVGAICAYFSVRADLRRRNLRANAAVIVASTVIVGALAAKLQELAHAHIASRFELGPWYVAAITSAVALLLLARRYRIPVFIMLDVAATAAMSGYVASLLAAILTVDITAYYRHLYAIEVVAEVLIWMFLWREGRATVQWQRPNGIVAGEYLVLSGALWLLVDSLAGWFSFDYRLGSIFSMVAGAAIIAYVLPQYLRAYEGHRVLEHQAALGESVQPEYTPATRECPHPERWKMYDSMTAEVEVLDFLKSLITTVKPSLVVETGTFAGISTIAIAEGLRQNGFGKIITCEFDPKIFARAKQRIDASGLGRWVEYRNESSLEMNVEGEIDLLFSDSEQTIRDQEVRRFLPQMNPNGLILIHDANSHARIVREGALRLEQEGLISVVLLPTPRGLVIAQKREGR